MTEVTHGNRQKKTKIVILTDFDPIFVRRLCDGSDVRAKKSTELLTALAPKTQIP